jgi:vancomycin permeability regulator SanA
MWQSIFHSCSSMRTPKFGIELRSIEFSRVEIAIKNSLLPKDVFRHDDAARADIGIVMGSPDAEHLRQRIAAGISLFKAGKVPRLIVCGDGREKDSQQKSEAVRMKEIAVKAGVPEASIIIEDTGHDPIESAKACGRLLKSDSSLQSVKSAFLVSSAWHLLRMSIVMKRYVPNKVTLYCYAATEGVTASNWQTSPQNRAIVENELRLIEKLLKTGFSLK